MSLDRSRVGAALRAVAPDVVQVLLDTIEAFKRAVAAWRFTLGERVLRACGCC
jgi:hypothetical protein